MDCKRCNGISKTAQREPNDFYATPPHATEELLKRWTFHSTIWEPCCGKGHISDVLMRHDYAVYNSDLIDRGYKYQSLCEDFLQVADENLKMDIITNPPYKNVNKYVEKALNVISDGYYVAMLLKLTFLESKTRKRLFEKYPVKYVFVFSERINISKNADFENTKGQNAIAYAWFLWEKGYKGESVIQWI